jgi:Flp pilus assembly pilin Flp
MLEPTVGAIPVGLALMVGFIALVIITGATAFGISVKGLFEIIAAKGSFR